MNDERSLAADLAHTLRPTADADLGPRSSPAAFATYAGRGKWRLARHLDHVNERLCALARGDIRRLLVLAPPRHGKSELCSHWFIAWFLGRYPNARVILVSYEQDFAATFGRKVRDTLATFGPKVFGVDLRGDVSAAARFELAGFSGGMVCAGAGGPITGRGADVFVIDDPIKNFEEADSETMRERMWEWYRTTCLTRLQPGGRMLVVMTHWHSDDIGGRLQALPESERFEVVRLPALAEEDDVLGRDVGEPLWPEEYGVDELASRRREMGSAQFSALYQGRPQPAEGSMFKREWIRHWRPVIDGDGVVGYALDGEIVSADDCYRFGTVDLATTLSAGSDYTVICSCAVTPRCDLIVLDMDRRRLEGPDLVPAMKNAVSRHGLDYIGIEKAGFQAAIIQQAKREDLVVRELVAEKNKVSRAAVATVRMEAGQVFFPEGADFLDDLTTELLTFPTGRHDDMVDALTYACIEVGKQLGNWEIAWYLVRCTNPDCDTPYPETDASCPDCGYPNERLKSASSPIPTAARSPRGTKDAIYYDETSDTWVEDLTTPRPLPGAPWPQP